MKSFKLPLITLIIIISACSKEKVTKINKTNVVSFTANRKVPKTYLGENDDLLGNTTLSRIIKSRNLFNYHIIGGSSNEKRKALSLNLQLYKKGYPCRVIEQNGKYHVIIQSFSDKNQAERELKRLKKLNNKTHLWILKN